MEEKVSINYGEALKEQREKLGLSQSAVANKINTSHQNISRWESGKILPSIDFCVNPVVYFDQLRINRAVQKL